jgi:hypothetical protein
VQRLPMRSPGRSQQSRAYARRDPTRKSRTHGGVGLLVEALDQLVIVLVEVRRRRHGGECGPTVELGTIAKIFFTPRILGHMRTDNPFDDVDRAIKDTMTDIGGRLAARLDFEELHDTVERIAGDPSRMDWGQRFTPIASALNGAVTRDGVTWCT